MESERQFRAGLYREHIEEAAFLYGQGRHLRDEAGVPWTRLHDLEQRHEAHVDALVVGGGQALDLAAAHATEGDADEFHAAVTLFCRRVAAQPLAQVLSRAAEGSDDLLTALHDALAAELPPAWAPMCVRAAANGPPRLQAVFRAALAHRRIAHEARLPPFAAGNAGTPSQDTVRLLWSAGRSTGNGDLAALRTWYADERSPVREAALCAGLRLGDRGAFDALRASGADCPRALAVGGGPWGARALLARLESGHATADDVAALAMLGELSAVRPLVARLVDDAIGEAAAWALEIITGAHLFETRRVEEVGRDDELFDDELHRLREHGTWPVRADGAPYGSELTAPTRNIEAWQRWLRDNASRFRADLRYRMGRPCSPAVSLLMLGSEAQPAALRALLLDELVVRYRIDLRLEADMPVARQRQLLHEGAGVVLARTSSFEPGSWGAAA